MVREIAKKYRTSDGAEFDGKAEAVVHEELIECMEEYEAAKKRFARAVLKTQKTADGEPFDLTKTREYYRVREWPYFPELERIIIYPHSVVIDERDCGCVIDGKWEGSKWKTTEYRISSLYYSEENALKALLAAQERELEVHAETVEETRRRAT